MKATFIKNIYNKFNHNSYQKLYEYRGHEYLVTVYIIGFPLGESLREQHAYEQARIDKMIEEENKSIEPYNDECENAIKAFFEWCDS